MTSPNPPTRAAVAAVVVTYHPDAALACRLSRVIPQVGSVFVIDNASDPPVAGLLTGASGLEVVRNERNLGLAAALNQGMRRTAELGYEWVLTLDQDSTVDLNLVNSLAELYHLCPQRSQVGIISANYRSPHSGRIALRCPSGAGAYVECTTAITSGSLISQAAYMQAGPFREDFFIEGVDLEYCLRLRRRGYKILTSCRPLMAHASGAMEEVRLLGRIVLVPHHAAWRYYYMVRNFILIVRGYFWQEPRWVVATAIGVMKMMARVALFERDRRAKFAAMCRGFRDAMGVVRT